MHIVYFSVQTTSISQENETIFIQIYIYLPTLILFMYFLITLSLGWKLLPRLCCWFGW